MARIHELVELLKQAPDEVFVQPHNVPDPDAIASSFGLSQLLAKLGVPTVVVYEDEIEKANSVTMLRAFGIDMRHSAEVHTLGSEDWTVLVDVQKDNSNLTNLVTDEVACIDHHQYNGPKGYRFEDVRPEVGSCSAIIAQYYQEADVEPSPSVATALVYGIFMDTDNLTRGVNSLDIDMFYWLYRHVDIALINDLKANQITRADLHDYARAFETVEVYGEIGFLRLENANDSLLGAASDIVITISGVNVVVSYSIRESGIKYSTRSVTPSVNAGALVRAIVDGHGIGGGHNSMAGGFIKATAMPNDRSVDTFTRVRAVGFVERTKSE
ncbi:MAG: DHH family phosphoesterase [Spirochaetaceae bacterium]|nr:MAG: DHH family phosphoesterase [Spirochaetaceae bacterium]